MSGNTDTMVVPALKFRKEVRGVRENLEGKVKTFHLYAEIAKFVLISTHLKLSGGTER